MKQVHILLISESEKTYFQITELMNKSKAFSARIHWARNVKLAANLLSKGFNVCLFDEDSNSSGAIEFIDYIKSNKVDLPLIVISAGKSKDRDLRLLRAGASDYLIKDKMKAEFLHRSIAYACERSTRQKHKIRLQNEVLREQKLSSLGELAGNIAYRLGGYLETIADSLDKISPIDQSHEFAECQKALDKSRKVIKTLLAFSKVEIDVIPDIELREQVIEATEFLNQATRSAINVISLIDCQEDIFVNLNPTEFKQILTNLVLNAQDASISGGTVTIKLTETHGKDLPASLKDSDLDYACVSVEDQGIGIAPEYMDHLFEPTFSTKKSMAGMGLGLSMVFATMKAHGGGIAVDTELGKGTCFNLFFPISKTKKAAEDLAVRGMVMVVEPNDLFVEVCKLYFSAASLDSRVFCDNKEAIDWFGKNYDRVDLVMLADDYQLLDLQIIRDLKSINPEVKIVLVNEATDHLAEQLGDNGVVRVVRPHNKYLSVITWVGEGLGLSDAEA